MTSYEDKSAVITGGSSGIGFEIARLLAEHGARVLITGRNQDTLDDARERLGDAVIAIHSDASALGDIDALAARANDELGALDAVFANAGINGFAPRGGDHGRALRPVVRGQREGPVLHAAAPGGAAAGWS